MVINRKIAIQLYQKEKLLILFIILFIKENIGITTYSGKLNKSNKSLFRRNNIKQLETNIFLCKKRFS